MFHVITKEPDINLDEIKVFKPYTIDERIIVNIGYSHTKPLLIQTPVTSLPFRYNLFDDKYFYMDLVIIEDSFLNIINIIKDTILKSKRVRSLIQERTFMAPSGNKFRFRNCDVDSISVFDMEKNRIDIRNIQRDDRIKIIFQIERLVFDKTSYYFIYKVIQIQKENSACIDPYNQNECMFQGSNQETSKYDKMLKMGIPLLAVKQKMAMDGVLPMPNLNIKNNNTKLGIPPPPPPPIFGPPKPSLLNLSSTQPLAFLSDIKSGNFALKKATTIVPSKKILKYVDTSKKVPSLEEILNAKERLRKTAILT